MSNHSGHYSIEELLALRESPLVSKPEALPQMEQWMQPAMDRRALQNAQPHTGNGESDPKFRATESRRARGDSIVLGPPPMSFASSLHSPPLRKMANKDSMLPSMRNGPSPPHDDIALSTSPPDEEEEAGWSKVRSAGRGHATRGLERRGPRSDRKAGREALDGLPLSKGTAFRNYKEGESQNWRNERAEFQSYEQAKSGRWDDRADFLEEEEFDRDGLAAGGGGGKEHSAAEFQAWITKMRGGNPKSENSVETQNIDNDPQRNSVTNEQSKADKSKIVDVDSLFALDPPSVDEISQNTPASSVFFDSAPTGGRASRFRQLFAQEPHPPQPTPFEANRRPSVDRMNSNPLFNNGPGAGASSEDREGFQRIMAMLGGGGGSGGGGGQTHMSHFFRDKPPPLQSQPPIHEAQGQGESKNQFFQRLLRQGQANAQQSPPFNGPPLSMNARNNGPIDQGRPSQADMDATIQSRMGRPQPPPHSRSQHSDPRFSPYDLPPQGAPWMHPPPGFSSPSSRFPFPGPPLSPGLPPPPPTGGFGPPPPGMMPFGGPPPGFGRGVFNPPPPPPGQDNWHGPPGFAGNFYQEAEGRER